MELKEYEVIDELNINNLKIIQNVRGFKYGTDAVMLAKFANIKNNGRVLDLCTGGGIVPILLCGLKNPSHVTGVEYFSEYSEMAERSVELNRLADRIKIVNGDVKNLDEYINPDCFDNVTVNPPYKAMNTGFVNENDYKTAARHEVLLTLSQCVKAAEYALKFGGKLTMVNRIDRLSDVFYEFKKNKIEPKRICFITPDINIAPKIFVIEGIKGGKSGMTVEPYSQFV